MLGVNALLRWQAACDAERLSQNIDPCARLRRCGLQALAGHSDLAKAEAE